MIHIQLWNSHNLDKAVAQSQAFINECRRALGLSMKFWVAEIHEIVKNTILHYSELRAKCGELNNALKQVKFISHCVERSRYSDTPANTCFQAILSVIYDLVAKICSEFQILS